MTRLVSSGKSIQPAVAEALAAAVISGDTLRLTGTLPRKVYEGANAILEASGWTWDRRRAAHIAGDPGAAQGRLEEILGAGWVPLANPDAFFATPRAVAERMAELARLDTAGPLKILEPSAGEGDIVRWVEIWLAGHAATTPITWTLVESDPDRFRRLASILGEIATQADFLVWTDVPPGGYDRVIMNPPFTTAERRDCYIDHIGRAYGILAPGGRLVAVAPIGFTYRQQGRPAEFARWLDEHGGSWQELPGDAFKDSGTGVKAVLLVVDKPATDPPPDDPFREVKQAATDLMLATLPTVTSRGRPPRESGTLFDLDPDDPEPPPQPPPAEEPASRPARGGRSSPRRRAGPTRASRGADEPLGTPLEILGRLRTLQREIDAGLDDLERLLRAGSPEKVADPIRFPDAAAEELTAGGPVPDGPLPPYGERVDEPAPPRGPMLDAILAVDPDRIDVVDPALRRMPRKARSAAIRGLVKRLGLRGISVTTPDYSMASTTEVRIPEAVEHDRDEASGHDWATCPVCEQHVRAEKHLRAILLRAFPDMGDRSDSQSDHYDNPISID